MPSKSSLCQGIKLKFALLKNSTEYSLCLHLPTPLNTMKFISLVIVALTLPALTLATSVTYDTMYDNGSQSLNAVACSNGENGLETQGFTTFKSLPSFPYIGGASAVAGWNSPNCGTCWKLTYTNSEGKKKSINVLAVDHAGTGFNIALKAMNDLTSGQAKQLGRVNVVSEQVAASNCKM
jgi:hypothetical protein